MSLWNDILDFLGGGSEPQVVNTVTSSSAADVTVNPHIEVLTVVDTQPLATVLSEHSVRTAEVQNAWVDTVDDVKMVLAFGVLLFVIKGA